MTTPHFPEIVAPLPPLSPPHPDDCVCGHVGCPGTPGPRPPEWSAELFRTDYRSLTPDGEIWVESSDPADMDRPGPVGGALLSFQQMRTYLVRSPWEPYTPPMPDTGGTHCCGDDCCGPDMCSSPEHEGDPEFAPPDEPDDTCRCGHPECGAC